MPRFYKCSNNGEYVHCDRENAELVDAEDFFEVEDALRTIVDARDTPHLSEAVHEASLLLKGTRHDYF